MRTHTGVATRMFAALAERGININLINTSEVRINVGTDIDRGREGLECLEASLRTLASGSTILNDRNQLRLDYRKRGQIT